MKRGPKCTICEHDNRAEIELALANKVPYRTVTKRFGVGKDTCSNHKRHHMTPELLTRLKATGADQPVDLERARTLLRTLEMLEAKTRGNLEEAEIAAREAVAMTGQEDPAAQAALAAVLSVVGLYLFEHAFVMAPQEVPNS